MDSRIKHIMGKYYFKSKIKYPISVLRDIVLNKLLNTKDNKDLEVFIGCSVNSKEHKERMDVFLYFYKQGYDDKYIESQWLMVQMERRSQSEEYKKKPKRERKDNQNPLTNTINYGSGGGWSSIIRVPSKKHKNRWKNFTKLFPKYKEK
jgi:hypothetical protein